MKVPQLLSYLTILSGPVLAANLKNVAACETPSNLLQISGTYCGSGTFVEFTLTGDITESQQCFNKANNQPQGKPKSTSSSFSDQFDVPLPKNGCADFFFETPAITTTTLKCPPGQTAKILGVTYDNVLLDGTNLPTPYTIGDVTGKCPT
jgi:hypothetical protein